MSYHYYDIDFNRPKNSPVTEEEYELIKKDYEGFIYMLEDKILAAKEFMPAPNKIRWPYFFLLLITSALLYYLGRYMFNQTSWGGFLAGAAGLLGLLTLLIPLRALLLGKMDSNLHIKIRIAEIKNYFDFHYPRIQGSENYEAYTKTFP
jgi:hypothetical protein